MHEIGDFFRETGICLSEGIRMRKKQIAAISLTLWLIIISCFMLLVGRFDLALFFVLGFIGFLLIVELTELRYVKTDHLKYVRYLICVGIVIFGAIVVQKLMEILGLYFIWNF